MSVEFYKGMIIILVILIVVALIYLIKINIENRKLSLYHYQEEFHDNEKKLS